MESTSKIGVVATGGGARGAYQAGVLKGICKITRDLGVKVPFSVLSGISVGAINLTYLAAHADDMYSASSGLATLWGSLRSKQVIKTDPISLARVALRLLIEITTGGIIKTKKARSLLDNTPLKRLIEKEINFDRIQENVVNGKLSGVAITSVNYSNGRSCNFYHTNDTIPPWIRAKRAAIPTKITKEHVIASSAIPLYFPPQEIDSCYYADGNLRNYTPLSPAIKLGADKLFIIPVGKDTLPDTACENFEPTLGRMISVLLNSLLLDAVDFDIERLTRINDTLSQVPDSATTPLRKVESCVIRPSEDLGEIAREEVKSMPRSLRHLVKGMGSAEDAEGIISVLLFESSYTQRLIELGYHDAFEQQEEIVNFYR